MFWSDSPPPFHSLLLPFILAFYFASVSPFPLLWKFYSFVMAAQGLCCFLQLLRAGLLFIVVASLVAEHRLKAGRQAQGLPRSMWDLPGPGTEPMAPPLAGRFLTTASGKSVPPPSPAPFKLLYLFVIYRWVHLFFFHSVKLFKHTANLKAFYNKHLPTCFLDSRLHCICLVTLLSICPSSRSFFLMHFQVIFQHRCTSTWIPNHVAQ